jgi:hypothetical protein
LISSSGWLMHVETYKHSNSVLSYSLLPVCWSQSLSLTFGFRHHCYLIRRE